MSRSGAGGRFVFGALLATLALAALLAVDALRAARSHRSVAEGVLRDYARLAAGQLEARVTTGLAPRLFPILTAIPERGSPAAAASLAAAADTATARMLAGITGFRLDPASRLIESWAGSVDGHDPPVVADTIARHAAAVLSPRSYLALLWLSDGRVAVFRRAGSRLVGFFASRDAIRDLVAAAIGEQPLLPPSLTGGTPVDSVAWPWIIAGDSRPLIGTEAAGPFSAVRDLAPMWGGVRVGVRLDETLASRLIIGGLPRSRLPVVLSLLGLTALLVGAAAAQLRRERALVRLREEFVAGASHELRTPLAQIRLFVETLRLGRIRSEDERDRSLEIIDRESRRLGQLIENLLGFGRAGRTTAAGAAPLVDVGAETRRIVAELGPLAEARSSAVEVIVAGEPRAAIAAEELERIVVNLVDNAIKYGPEGQTVRVTVVDAGGSATLTVDDEGPGVPAGDRERIFERFVRLGPAGPGGRTAGTGLGLALVRELVRARGGRCRVESAPGGGARFVVEFTR